MVVLFALIAAAAFVAGVVFLLRRWHEAGRERQSIPRVAGGGDSGDWKTQGYHNPLYISQASVQVEAANGVSYDIPFQSDLSEGTREAASQQTYAVVDSAETVAAGCRPNGVYFDADYIVTAGASHSGHGFTAGNRSNPEYLSIYSIPFEDPKDGTYDVTGQFDTTLGGAGVDQVKSTSGAPDRAHADMRDRLSSFV